MYWDDSIPRILTNEQVKHVGDQLYSVADISCDIDGGIEFTTKATTIDKPFYYFDPATLRSSSEYIFMYILTIQCSLL